MQPCGAKKQTPGTHLPEDPRPKENPYKVQWENCHCYCGHNPFLNADYVHDLIITKDSDMDLETISWVIPPRYQLNETGSIRGRHVKTLLVKERVVIIGHSTALKCCF